MVTSTRMRSHRWTLGALASALLALVVTPSCGDGLAVGFFATMEVSLNSGTILTGNGSHTFPVDGFREIPAEVSIKNTGTSVLIVEGIDWATSDTGQDLVNPHVRIDFRGAIGADSFPFEVNPGSSNALTFAVVYSPHLNLTKDVTPSVLEIRSNGRIDGGDTELEALQITFELGSDIATPQVTPSNRFCFTNATIARPERQDFRIYNASTDPFHVRSVRFENATTEFSILNEPSQATAIVDETGVVFTVEYAPKDDEPDSNALLIETDVNGAGSLRVELCTDLQTGSYSLSYDDPNAFDFTNVSTRTTRSVLISSDGPGPITIKTPRIEPTVAQDDYTFTGWIPATTEGGTDTEVTSYPRALAQGRTLRMEVTFAPSTSNSANGQLIIPFDSPDPSEIIIDLFSGVPKSKIVLGPATGSIVVTGDAQTGETGSRTVMVYNEGNGPLSIVSAKTKTSFSDGVVFAVSGTVPTTIAAGGVAAIDVTYDLGALPGPDATASESLEITYFDDFTQANETINYGLIGRHHGGLALPVANPGSPSDYADSVANEAITLSAAASTPGGGAFQANNRPYAWYLVAKPATSNSRLNVTTGSPTVQFVPDVAGTYTFGLMVFSQQGDAFLYSTQQTVTVTVGE